MTIKFEDNNGYRFLIGTSIKDEMQRLWKLTIIMSENGYGKHYFDDEIDKLADFLIQYYQQTTWLKEL